MASYRELFAADGPDPFILATSNGWWLYTTGKSDEGGIPLYFSFDLEDWEARGMAVLPGPKPESWNRRNFRAPEIYVHEGWYYLYYTAMPDGTPGNEGNHVGCAVSRHPGGPFEDRGVVIKHSAIDGSLFKDDRGAAWMLFTAEYGNRFGLTPGVVGVHRMISPLEAEPDPRVLIQHLPWQEGGFLYRYQGKLILFYSAGNGRDGSYHLRYAVTDHPLGPYRFSETKLLETQPGEIGPGHANWFEARDGEHYLCYHAWNDTRDYRSPRIRPLAPILERIEAEGRLHWTAV